MNIRLISSTVAALIFSFLVNTNVDPVPGISLIPEIVAVGANQYLETPIEPVENSLSSISLAELRF